jgi:smad nuclear-interacting protein 1
MKDSSAVTKMKHGRKRSRSSSDGSVSSPLSSDAEYSSFPLSKDGARTKSPETLELNSDSDSSRIIVNKSRKSKKHKHSVPDSEVVHVIPDGRRHRHRCHHHSHHRHGHSSRDKEERIHKQTCTRHKTSLEAVKIKKEPIDDDSGRIRRSHSSYRRPERRRATSEDDHIGHHGQPVRQEGIQETLPTSKERNQKRREGIYPRNEKHGNKSDHVVPDERQTRKSEEQESRGNRSSRNGRRGVPEVRRNRWGNEEENATSISRPIKQEPNSGEEGEYVWGRKPAASKEENILPGQKDKPNFGLSGKLAEDTNTFNGVVIKYSQPPEARKPKRRWRFYPFKGDKGLPTLYIHRQSSYLIGRDRKVADIPVDHPSCSKQHAALQYRLVPFEREDGTMAKRVRPYIIDLESSNGTYVNNVKIDPRTYVELLEKDVIKFGYSSREYVLLHEQSKDEQLDDDVATGGND